MRGGPLPSEPNPHKHWPAGKHLPCHKYDCNEPRNIEARNLTGAQHTGAKHSVNCGHFPNTIQDVTNYKQYGSTTDMAK